MPKKEQKAAAARQQPRAWTEVLALLAVVLPDEETHVAPRWEREIARARWRQAAMTSAATLP